MTEVQQVQVGWTNRLVSMLPRFFGGREAASWNGRVPPDADPGGRRGRLALCRSTTQHTLRRLKDYGLLAVSTEGWRVFYEVVVP